MAVTTRVEMWSAKKILAPPHTIDLSAANIQHNFTVGKVFVDTEFDCKVRMITFVYTVATDANASAETIQVGTVATAAIWLNSAPTVSQALGTVESKTVLLPDTLLSAGTPLVIQKSAGAGTTNTGEVTVIVALERIHKGEVH